MCLKGGFIMKSITQKTALILTLSSLFLFSSCDFKKSEPISLVDKLNPANQGLGGGGTEPVDPNEPEVRPEDQLITFTYLKKTAFISCKSCHSKTTNPKKRVPRRKQHSLQ